jgi:predicted TIM-barrel fold metal-dependent hydrolase
MSIIDAHVHLYPEAVNRDPLLWAQEHGETHWAILCTRRRKSGQWVQGFPNVDELLRRMDEAGVTRAVLQGWYWQWPETCALQNDFYAECVKAHPDRLSAFATLHPSAGREATLELVRTARERGFSGLGELSPHSQGYDVGEPVFLELMELAGDLRLPVNLHVTDHQSGAYPGRVETPLRDFLWLARQLPHTNFILAHWGGLLPLHEEEAENLYNVFYDTAASPLLYGEDIWSRFAAVVPPERVLFGSDYPLNLYPRTDTEPALTGLVNEARKQGADLESMARNTLRLLHVKA